MQISEINLNFITYLEEKHELPNASLKKNILICLIKYSKLSLQVQQIRYKNVIAPLHYYIIIIHMSIYI